MFATRTNAGLVIKNKKQKNCSHTDDSHGVKRDQISLVPITSPGQNFCTPYGDEFVNKFAAGNAERSLIREKSLHRVIYDMVHRC
jgi:hypothetical protein